MELTFLDLVKIMMGAFVGASAGVITGNALFRLMNHWKTKRQINRVIRRARKENPWLFEDLQQKK